MAEQTAQTAAGEYVLPVEDVTLTGKALRRKDGAPLVVRCEFVEEERLLAVIEAAPGFSPELGVKEQHGNVETARALLRYAPGLLGISCSLVAPDGTLQRPAFHFGADPGDGSLPGRYLRTPEKLVLLMAVLRVSGFVGGPAESVRFHGADGARGDGGAGGVDAGEGHGDAPGGAAVRQEPGGSDAADAGAGG